MPMLWRRPRSGLRKAVRCRSTPSTRNRRSSGRPAWGLELEEQAPKLDTLLVAVGGGGLIGGIAAWYEKRIRLIGVEPRLAPTLSKAFEGGGARGAGAPGVC